MLKLIKLYTATIRRMQSRLASAVSWHGSVKGTKRLVGVIMKMVVPLVVGKTSTSWAGAALCFAKYVRSIVRHQGTRGLVLKLKALQIMTMQSLSEGTRYSGRRLGGGAISVTGSGLPRVIPVAHRHAIRRGSRIHIQFWLTLFGLYRILEIRPVWKLGSITETGRTPEQLRRTVGREDITIFWSALVELIGERGIPTFRWSWEPFAIFKSSPNGSDGTTSLWNLVRDTWAWTHHPLQATFQEFLEATQREAVWSRIKTMSTACVGWWDIDILKWNTRPLGFLGKLGLKFEPAGKVRVFAMVDWWTQVALRPLHQWIFSVLRLIPQDATFDQLGAVQSFASSLKQAGKTKVYSLDLSSATDRLPLMIQVWLLTPLLGERVASLWALMLVGRAYRLPKHISLSQRGNPVAMDELLWKAGVRSVGFMTQQSTRNVFYSVGQPMGALSSWAMLALTHHFTVQLAARRAGLTGWFTWYLVLGDDIVIADGRVARQYIELMRELGVGLSLAKSLVSNNASFEFARQFVFRGEPVTGFAWKEMIAARGSLAGLMALFQKTIRQPSLSIHHVARFMGFGHRVRSLLNTPILSVMRGHRRFGLLLAFLRAPDVSPFSWAFSDWVRLRSWGHTLERSNRSNVLQSFKDTSIKDLLSHKGEEILFDAENLFGGDPYTGALFRQEIQPIINTWVNDLEHAMIELETLSDQVFDPEVLDTVWTSFVEAQSKLAELPKRIDPSEREGDDGKGRPVGQWLKLWLRLNRAARVPSGEAPTRATMSN
jgi:hypothetical protein